MMNRHVAMNWHTQPLDEVRLADELRGVFRRSDVAHGALMRQRADGHYKLGAGSSCFPSDLLSMCESLAERNRHPGLLIARDRYTPFSIAYEEAQMPSSRETREFLDLVAAANLQSFYFLPLRDSKGNLFVSAVASRQRKLDSFGLRLIHSYCFDALERLTTEQGADVEVKSKLTRRERECLIAAAKGFTENRTAALLSISPFTVHAHLASCKKKLGARNKLNAIVKGLSLGELLPADVEIANALAPATLTRTSTNEKAAAA